MIEEWKDVKGYEGLYQVSNLGITRNTVTNRIKSGLIKRKVVYLCDQES